MGEEVRKKLRSLVDANRFCPELEKLEPQEFCIDWEERDRIAALTKERCDALEAKIKRENVERHMIKERMVEAFWNPMKEPGTNICSLSSDLAVANYPERKRAQESLRWKQVKQFRDIEELERNWRESSDCPDALRNKIPTYTKFAEGKEEYLMNFWAECDDNVRKVLYAPFELVTEARRRMQVIFLKELADTIRHNFNGQFKEMQDVKKSEMATISDRTERIRQILGELQADETTVLPKLLPSEIPDSVL